MSTGTESSKQTKLQTGENLENLVKEQNSKTATASASNSVVKNPDFERRDAELKKHLETMKRETINLKEFILNHFKKGSRAHKYEENVLHELLIKAKHVFKNGPSLVEVKAPVNICGDVHGQYTDLLRIFNACGMPMKQRYLFLGDYIDRGRHSLEVICLLFALRIQLPTKVYLLRGNHEIVSINKSYGFYAELQLRFRDRPTAFELIWHHFNEVFSYMPLAGLVAKRILCMHGGLSPELKTMDDIRNIQRPLFNVKVCPLAQDLLWSDPEPGVKGFEKNKVRSVSHVFGEEIVHQMCKQLDIDMVVRAHQVVEYGYSFFAKRSLITVFSASRYHEEMYNYAAVVVVGPELELSFTQLKPTEFEKIREEAEKRKEPENEATSEQEIKK